VDSCHLLRPDWLWLVIPLALLIWLLGRRRAHAGSWRSVCDNQLLPYVLQGREVKTGPWPLLLVAIGGLLAIFALSGPTCQKLEQPVFRDQSALVIALDLSRSMDATDLKPSRLERAKLKLIDILKQRKEGQTALLVYAADAYTVSPLTDDSHTIISLIGALDSNMMPAQGSRADVAIAQAAELLQQAGVPKGDILLITDGVNRVSAEREVENYQHRVSVLGVGTPAGAPIAKQDGGFVLDSHGNIVIPKLDESALKSLASKGHGRYSPLTPDDRDIAYLLDIVKAESDSQKEVKGLNSDQWKEAGPLLLLALLPLAALVFRRGYLVAIVLAVALPLTSEDSYAQESSLWLNDNQLGKQLLEEGRAEDAAATFTDPQWQAGAQYKAGNFKQAAEQFNGINTADALYNKGNALARQGDFENAIQAYDEALKLNPDDEDAKYNRDIVEKAMQKQQQPNQDKGKGDKSQKDSKGESKDQQQGDGQGDQQQSQQSESADQGDQSKDQQQQQAGQSQQQQGEQQQGEQQAKQEATEQTLQSQDKDKRGDEQQGTKKDAKDVTAQPSQDLTENSESDIATEQWLRRIPDDPGGLMRRKFQYQYQRQQRNNSQEAQPW